MSLPFAYELGQYDPTFPGITINYPTKATWEKSSEVAALVYCLGARDLNARPKRRGWARLWGGRSASVDPYEMQALLLADPTVGLNLSPDQAEEVGQLFISSDPDCAVANLAIATATEHERRHFHDWLLSPYTALINSRRSETFANFRSVFWALLANGTTVIPVPLSRWLRKSPAEQQSLVEMWQSILGETARVQPPDFTYPRLREAVAEIAQHYRSTGWLFEQIGGTEIDGAAVFEASALLIQGQSIHDVFGEGAMNRFNETMIGLGKYRWFPQVMMSAYRPGEIPENDTLSAIAVWCLLGNTVADSANANPVVRLNHALRCVADRGFTNLDIPTAEILDQLDRFAGVMPYRHLLEHSIELGGNTVQWIENMAERNPFESDFILGVADMWRHIHGLHEYMARLFLDDPGLYCQPVQYLDHGLGKLPEPPIRYTFGGPFHAVRRSNLDKFDHVKIFGPDTPDEVFVREIVVNQPNGMVDLQFANSWQYLCAVTDTIFAESNRGSPAIEAQKAAWKDDGVVLCLEVLS